jgi:hypothetical protein
MKMTPVYKVHEGFKICFADGDLRGPDLDFVLLYTGNGALCYDIGEVHPDEFVRRKLIFEGF